MKFSTKEDIDAPIEAVFDNVADFDRFERYAARRGATIRRTDTMESPGVGLTWDVVFPVRGRTRNAALRLVAYDPPAGFVVEGVSDGMAAVFEVDLLALSPKRTRLSVAVELKPQTLTARLVIQSFKLARTQMTKRFKLRVAEYAKEVEERCGRTS